MTYALASDGVRLWYRVIPGVTPSLPPLILIQGRALDHHGWDSALDDFRQRTVVVFDHRGTGLSGSEFPTDWSTRDFSRDVISVLDAAGIGRAHVYGHSMGGRVAQWIAVDHPDRVRSVVLGATSVGDESGPSRPAEGLAALASGDPARLAALFYPDWWILQNPTKTGAVLPAAHSVEAAQVHARASDLRDGPSPTEIDVPTLVVQGADDQLVDLRHSDIFGSAVPEVQVMVLPAARHAYWIGEPAAHQRVDRFLAINDERAR